MSKDGVALSMPPAYPGLPEPRKTDVTPFPIFGSESANMLCKSCNLQVITSAKSLTPLFKPTVKIGTIEPKFWGVQTVLDLLN